MSKTSLIDRFFSPPGSISPDGVQIAETVDDPADQHLRRNFIFNMLHQISLYFGDAFAAYQTILPVYAATLTRSPVLIGLVPSIVDAGWYMPQLFFAPVLERLPRRKAIVLGVGVIERLPYLLLALTAVWLSRLQGNLPIIIFLFLLTWRSLAGGFAGLPWQDFIAKVIPDWLRGRFFGISHFGGKLFGLAAASVAGLILARLPYPQNYSLLFLLAFLFLSLSLVFFSFTKETDSPAPPVHQAGAELYRSRIWRILRENRNFTRYLVSRGLSYMGNMGFSFVAVYAIQQFGLGDAYAATFTSILMAGSTLAIPLWGFLRDRIGSKVIMALSSVCLGTAIAVILFWPTLWGVYVAFALIGLFQPGNLIADINMPMEFEDGPYRPTYIGMARTLTAPLLLAAPVLGGVIIEAGGYTPMFIASVIFGGLGVILLVFGVKDPGHHHHQKS